MNVKIVFGLLLLAVGTAFGQSAGSRGSDPRTLGERTVLTSRILNQERPIDIYHPGEPYEGVPLHVLYVLDAERNFLFAAGMIDFLVNRAICPPILVVGIPNLRGRREVDLIPGNEAETFLKFLTQELIPYIDSSYNTAPFRIISGHSSGAIFSTFALLRAPEEFRAAIASSAVFKQGDTNLYDTFWDQFSKEKVWNHFYFHSVGTLETPTFFIQQNDSLNTFLGSQAPDGFSWQYHKIEDGDHNFVALPSLQTGLLELYKEWRIRLSYQIPFDVAKLRSWPERMAKQFGYQMRIPLTILIQRAMMLYFDDRFDESLPYFQLAVEQYPDHPDSHFWLARNYESLGDIEEAITSVARSVELARNNHQDSSPFEIYMQKLKARDGNKKP